MANFNSWARWKSFAIFHFFINWIRQYEEVFGTRAWPICNRDWNRWMAQILQFRTYLKDKKMEYNVTITQYLQSTFFISKYFLGYFDYKFSFRYPQYNPTDSSIITLEKLAILPLFLMKRTHFLSFWHCHFAIKEKKYKGKRKMHWKVSGIPLYSKRKNFWQLTFTSWPLQRLFFQ